MEKALIFTTQLVEEIRKDNEITGSHITQMSSNLKTANNKVQQLEEEVLRLERYSRGYNLRFVGIPERDNESPGYSYEKSSKKSSRTSATYHQRFRTPTAMVEFPKHQATKPRHILAKFIYRPERQTKHTQHTTPYCVM